MKCKAFIFGLLLGGVAFTASAVDLKTEGRDPKYVESIVGRSRKIVDKLELNNEDKANEGDKHHRQPILQAQRYI